MAKMNSLSQDEAEKVPNLIDITGVNLIKLIKGVYKRSEPIGMGYLHYTPGELTDAEAQEVLDLSTTAGHDLTVFMDYVKGRCCKFNVWDEGDKLMARSYWLDHSTAKYAALLQELGLSSLIETVEAYEQQNGAY